MAFVSRVVHTTTLQATNSNQSTGTMLARGVEQNHKPASSNEGDCRHTQLQGARPALERLSEKNVLEHSRFDVGHGVGHSMCSRKKCQTASSVCFDQQQQSF